MEGRTYFTDNSDLPSNRKVHDFDFDGHHFSFETDDGVFSKTGVDYGTRVLLKTAVREKIAGSVLDMGCGYGVIGIVLKTVFPDCTVTCCDINPRAAELAVANSRLSDVPVTVLVSDRFSNISGCFDAIITNPPIRAGKSVVYGIFRESYAHLKKGGLFLTVVRKQQGAPSALRELTSIFGTCVVADRDKGYWILKCVKN